jgi:hypothetical protein
VLGLVSIGSFPPDESDRAIDLTQRIPRIDIRELGHRRAGSLGLGVFLIRIPRQDDATIYLSHGKLGSRPVSPLPDKLDLALVKRLRDVVGGRPATESELRLLADQAGGWARVTEAQLRSAEQRLAKLNADPTSELGEMATEIRRTETLSAELDEARSLLAGLEQRTRELRTAWLKYHADSAPRFDPAS